MIEDQSNPWFMTDNLPCLAHSKTMRDLSLKIQCIFHSGRSDHFKITGFRWTRLIQTETIVLKLKAKSVPMVVLQWLNHWKSFKSKSLLISIDNIPSQQIEGNYTIMTQFLQTTSSVHTHGTISYNFKWIFSIGPSCWRKAVSHACNLTDIYGSGVIFTPPQ